MSIQDKWEISRSPLSTDTTMLYRVVLSVFFLSGITGLIYETLWTRMIVSIAGSAPFAVSIVLTVFMGGLGIGSWIVGKHIDHIGSPGGLLRLYGFVEFGIGVYGAILPILLILFRPFFVLIYNKLFRHFMAYNILMFIGCTVIILMPATCMGATLPILSRFYVTRSEHVGSHLGRLYGINTAGAAIGSLLCGFFLIGAWGVYETLWAAVTVNIMIGTIALALSRHPRFAGHHTYDVTGETGARTVDVSSFDHQIGIIALTVFAVSGFCSMAYEVIWTRLLGLIVGPTTYSFTLVVAIFIFGLALGSMLFGRLADRITKHGNQSTQLALLLAVTQTGAAVSVLMISQFLGNSQLFFAKLIHQFDEQFALLMITRTAALFVLFAVPTILLGATFPLACKLYTCSIAHVGRLVGLAYAVNTAGAVLGSFAAGFILIPFLGKEHSIAILVAIQLISALVIGGYAILRSTIHRRYAMVLTIIALVVIAATLLYPRWDHHMLAIGIYHRADTAMLNATGWIDAILNRRSSYTAEDSGTLVYYGDGIGGFTTVLKYQNPLGGEEFSLRNSGKADAASWPEDMFTQTMLTHFPLAFHPDPKNVMVLGLASGITAGEVLHYPIERLDVVDINDQVVEACNFFASRNNNVLDDPRTDLIIQDGRAHLQMTDRTYDVIISEPSNPWMAGLASLFTRNFFTAVHEHMNDGGIFCQWVHYYQIDWENFAMIGRTFADIFPNSVFVSLQPDGTGADCLLIGFTGDRELDPAVLSHTFQYTRQSTNMSIPDPCVLYGLVIADNLADLFGTGPLNTDEHPRLEYGAPKHLYTEDPNIIEYLRSRRRLSPDILTQITLLFENVDHQIDLLEFLLSFDREPKGIMTIEQATAEQRNRYAEIMRAYCRRNYITDFSFIDDEALRAECFGIQIESMRKIARTSPRPDLIYNHIGTLLGKRGDYKLAFTYFQQAIDANPVNDVSYCNIAMIYLHQNNLPEAQRFLNLAFECNPSNTSTLNNLARLYAQQNKLDDAVRTFRKSLSIDPRQPAVLRLLADILRIMGKTSMSEDCLQKAQVLEHINMF